jgi:hypothetical protein
MDWWVGRVDNLGSDEDHPPGFHELAHLPEGRLEGRVRDPLFGDHIATVTNVDHLNARITRHCVCGATWIFKDRNLFPDMFMFRELLIELNEKLKEEK